MSSAEKLTIETPEQTSLEIPLAGIGSRFLALMLDFLVIGAAGTVGGIVAIALVSFDLFPEIVKQYAVALGIILFFVAEFGYFAAFEAIWNGQTPGKRWTHLRVIKDSGRPIATQDAVLRNLLRIVDYLPSFYAVGIICMLFSRENKRLGDFAAGTVVVHEKPLQGSGSLWSDRAAADSSAVAVQMPTSAPLVPPLTDDELQLIEAYLERRPTLDPTVSHDMARRIVERLSQVRAIPSGNLAQAEKFLESLAESRRNTARFR